MDGTRDDIVLEKVGNNEINKNIWIIRRLAALLLIGYAALIILFYFLAGEQLHLRQSRGNTELPSADSGTVELVVGSVVEQHFTVMIQRLEQINVQWGTYYRLNSGTVLMELIDLRNDAVLLSKSYEVAAITEGGLTALTAEQPIEGLYQAPLLLRITSPDCQPGSAVSPLMSTQKHMKEGGLTVNGIPVEGTLCFAVSGTDYIWTGLHYWEFAVVGALIISAGLGVIWLRVQHGKRSYIVNAVVAVKKYSFLIRQLVSRDFKTKYKRSVLGIFWSFLNPLFTMCIQYVVFSTIFKSDIAYYPAYLLIGIVSFNFFNEACGMSLTSIIGNAGLITKVYMPKYIYPLTRVMSSVVNLMISLLPLLLVCIFTGVQFHKSVILALLFLICLMIFSLGLGLLLSSAMVFFRDVQFLWGVFSMMWMYATPIFYPESILPENFQPILRINPLYHFLRNIRICILDGLSPEPAVYVQCFLIAIAMLIVGALMFRRTQDRFVLYL